MNVLRASDPGFADRRARGTKPVPLAPKSPHSDAGTDQLVQRLPLLWRKLGESVPWTMPIIEKGRWVANGGTRDMLHNLTFVYADPEAEGPVSDLVQKSLDEIEASGLPSLIALSRPPAKSIEVLEAAGYVQVSAQPFMRFDLAGLPLSARDPLVRRLVPDDVAEAQAVAAEAFNFGLEPAALAVPPKSAVNGLLWGLEVDGKLVSITVGGRAGSVVSLWTVATLPGEQHKNYGQRLKRAVHNDLAGRGVKEILEINSPAGTALNNRLGYETLEILPFWTRRRWAIL